MTKAKPVGISSGLLPLMAVHRGAAVPLQRQVYEGFRTTILRGDLRPGRQVPSSRVLAVDLGISRFPVLDAYAQLLAEGYFETRTGRGTFIAHTLPEHSAATQKAPGNTGSARPMAQRSSLIPEYKEQPWRRNWGAFGVHQPALDRFPFPSWSRLVARHSRQSDPGVVQHIDPLGLESFREAICGYLRTSRAVQCEPSQIMIVSGSQQALDITPRVLLDTGDPVWIEEPCYPLARAVLMGAGCRLIPVPVDDKGMNVAVGIERCRRARAAFVTPSHQYPLGSAMSASRRLQLLNWAEQYGSWIVEDDYDSEYRYEINPIPSLQGLDTNSRVIYIGTFSKVLFASLRLGYIVMPADLVERFKSVRFAMDIFPPYLYQQVLTEFIQSGQFTRHIRRMRALYNERRTALVEAIPEVLGTTPELHGAKAGMHIALTLPRSQRDLEIAARAARKSLWLWPLSPCYTDEKARQGFILGYGSTPVERIHPAVRLLRNALG